MELWKEIAYIRSATQQSVNSEPKFRLTFKVHLPCPIVCPLGLEHAGRIPVAANIIAFCDEDKHISAHA
jgi:hypothetical protein